MTTLDRQRKTMRKPNRREQSRQGNRYKKMFFFGSICQFQANFLLKFSTKLRYFAGGFFEKLSVTRSLIFI